MKIVVGHPLIHLGYAYEFASKELGMEALAMASSSYSYLHKYLDNPSYTEPSTYSTTSPLEILHKVHVDTRFDNLFHQKGADNMTDLFSNHESFILEHWNAWTLSDPIAQFRASQEAAVALLVNTVSSGTSYDFFLVHILTTSHAVRILLPLIPTRFHVSLVQQWWLLTLAVYICQLRPKIREETDVKLEKGKDWKYVEDKAVNGEWKTDAHFVKALRAMKEAAATWGDENGRYLGSAVKLVDGFHGWSGFGGMGEQNVN